VILIHRLLKNKIPSREYIAMTEAFHQPVQKTCALETEKHSEIYAELGKVDLYIHYPAGKTQPEETPLGKHAHAKGVIGKIQQYFEITRHRLFQRKREFHNLPY
jgi:hypothetical protein